MSKSLWSRIKSRWTGAPHETDAGAPPDARSEPETPPTQASLAAMLARVDRLRVIDGGMGDDRAFGDQLLLEVADPASLASLRECLTIVEDPASFHHCMCYGDPTLELFRGAERIAAIGLHHGAAIRWSAWTGDALLGDGAALRQWLAERGVTGPAEEYEDSARQRQQRNAALERWLRSTPPCLVPHRDMLMSFEVDHALLRGALADAHPDPTAQATALLRWLGSGSALWSAVPAYEVVVEDLLMQYPLEDLLGALTAAPDDEAALAGATRLFAGGEFRRTRAADLAAIPTEWKRRLLACGLAAGDEDRHARAREAFTS